ncbi:MAG: NAD-dependent epimerase/dehydratase family protein [Verrucomicrobiia bacterium]
MRILIVGCGYVGQQVAAELADRGHQVVGWVSSEDGARGVVEAGAEVVIGDATEARSWQGMKRGWDAVVFTASTSGGDEEKYQRIHGRALGFGLEAAEGRPFVYTSSTSVYGQRDGSWVNEESETVPEAATSRVLVGAERAVLGQGGVVLRLGGIYGPGRLVYYRRLREGTAVVSEEGGRWVNQVHRDDAAGAVVWALEQGRSGEVFNVVDDEPVRLGDLYRWLCGVTGLPLPQVGREAGPGKRGRTNKRVSNARIASAGWRPRWRTFREGYGRLLSVEGEAGR